MRYVLTFRLAALAWALFLVVLGAGTASAESPAEFYQGKRLTLVVPYGAGGGFDTISRVLAPWLERETGTEVVVENRPGGGGLVALNQVFAGDADGLTVILVNARSASIAQLLTQEGVRYDLLQLPWLARVTAEPSVILSGPESGLSTVADLVAAESIRWAGGGKIDSIADSAAAVSEALGLNSRIIIGYKGAKESALAVMRGEADAIVTSVGSGRRLVENGLVPVALLDRDRHELFPEVPTLFEAASLKEDAAWWLDFWGTMSALGRSFATAPGTDPERLAFLRDAFARILSNPEALAELAERKYIVNYLGGDDLGDLVGGTLRDIDEARLATIRQVVLDKYYQ